MCEAIRRAVAAAKLTFDGHRRHWRRHARSDGHQGRRDPRPAEPQAVEERPGPRPHQRHSVNRPPSRTTPTPRLTASSGSAPRRGARAWCSSRWAPALAAASSSTTPSSKASTAHGGELGHLRIDDAGRGRLCGCGARGCLEAYASATNVVRPRPRRYGRLRGPTKLRDYYTANDDDFTAKVVFELAVEGDELARRWSTTPRTTSRWGPAR